MADPTPATVGVDHVGLSVRNLESTRRFFCDCRGKGTGTGAVLFVAAAQVSATEKTVTTARLMFMPLSL